MKRPLLILLLFSVVYILSEVQAGAQLWKMRRYEASVGLGPSFFFGDIGGFSKTENVLGLKDMSFLQTRFNLNLNAKYRIKQDLNVRLSLTSGLLRATDSRGSNENRDMASSISIFEPALIGEFYFIKNKNEASYLFSKGRTKVLQRIMRSMDIYAFSGIGGLKYSVKGNECLSDKNLKTSGFTALPSHRGQSEFTTAPATADSGVISSTSLIIFIGARCGIKLSISMSSMGIKLQSP